jgi:hypoxanthine phosphoribosyltransferase
MDGVRGPGAQGGRIGVNEEKMHKYGGWKKDARFRRWDEVRFAHRSEQEFARLLDFYDIKWLYEPVSFDIAWDKKGNPVSKFTPDFYLPEYDLFIEITTMNQKLVTKKNRKIKRLKELYPDIKCKIFYRKDYRDLLFKYHINLDRGNEENGGGREVEQPPVDDLP